MSKTEFLLAKIQALSPQRLSEVEDFIDFVAERDQQMALVHAASAASYPTLALIWSNPEDDVYDAT